MGRLSKLALVGLLYGFSRGDFGGKIPQRPRYLGQLSCRAVGKFEIGQWLLRFFPNDFILEPDLFFSFNPDLAD